MADPDSRNEAAGLDQPQAGLGSGRTTKRNPRLQREKRAKFRIDKTMKLDLSRRRFLRTTGLGAGSLALGPLVHRLQAEAAGTAPAALRFVFVVESNGVRPEQIAPSGIVRKPRDHRPLNGPAACVDVSLHGRDLPCLAVRNFVRANRERG